MFFSTFRRSFLPISLEARVSNGGTERASMDIDEELGRLRELERTTLTACKVCADGRCLEPVLDPEYMRIRMSLVDTFERVATAYGLRWETVEYAIAWTDTFRARVKLGSRLPVYLGGMAALSLAIKYTTVCRFRLDELVAKCMHHLDTRWKSVSLTHSVEFTVREVAAAEFYLAAVLEWRMSAALPSSFLEVFFAKGIQASGDTVEGGDAPAAEQWAGVCKMASVLCQSGTFSGLSCVHGDSVLAAASIATARCISKIEPSWPAELQERFGLDEATIDPCVREVTRVYNMPTQHPADARDDRVVGAKAQVKTQEPQRQARRCG